MSCYLFSPSILMQHVRFFIWNITPKCSFILFFYQSIAVIESYRGFIFCANMERFIRLWKGINLGVTQSEAHFSLFNLGYNMVYFTSYTGISEMCSPMWTFHYFWTWRYFCASDCVHFRPNLAMVWTVLLYFGTEYRRPRNVELFWWIIEIERFFADSFSIRKSGDCE